MSQQHTSVSGAPKNTNTDFSKLNKIQIPRSKSQGKDECPSSSTGKTRLQGYLDAKTDSFPKWMVTELKQELVKRGSEKTPLLCTPVKMNLGGVLSRSCPFGNKSWKEKQLKKESNISTILIVEVTNRTHEGDSSCERSPVASLASETSSISIIEHNIDDNDERIQWSPPTGLANPSRESPASNPALKIF